MNQITIGLAGHIDHGKTSLVESLTGKNTDNLKEEIKRGMTIDIGFAHFNKTISLIDVPGHEKFIKNMVSGVSSIDAAIIVVAADDGIMPQTIEHLEILQLLGVELGIIVISKIDLVDNEWLELVEIEVKEYFKKTVFSNSKIFKISSVKDEGIESVKDEILKLSNKKTLKFDRDIFRLFIDRVFNVKGFGTVVTGTVSSGSAKIGDKLELLPGNNEIKIRGLQSHDEDVNEVILGQRAALNIQSINKINPKRGYQLSSKNFCTITSNIAVKLNLIKKTNNKLKHNQRIRLHLGTQESIGRILLLNNNDKEKFPALIKLEKAIIASYKDKFIIRSYSPVATIGGGTVLDINIEGKWNKIKEYLNNLYVCNNDEEFLNILFSYNIKNVFSIKALAKKMSFSVNYLKKIISNSNNIIYLDKEKEWVASYVQIEKIKKLIIDKIKTSHKKDRYKIGFIKEEINEKIKLKKSVLDFILKELLENKDIKLSDGYYSLINFEIKLNDIELNIIKKLKNILNNNDFYIISIKDLSSDVKQNFEDVNKIVKIQANLNKLFVLNDEFIISVKSYNILKEKIETFFLSNETMNVKEFKEIFNITRKYAVPILEFLDKQKITYRIGNERKINK